MLLLILFLLFLLCFLSLYGGLLPTLEGELGHLPLVNPFLPLLDDVPVNDLTLSPL